MAEKKQRLVNRGRVAALVFLVLLLLLLIFLLWWWFFNRNDETVQENSEQDVNTVVLPSQGTPSQVPTTIPVVAEPTDGELQVMTLARNYTERYGTYSSQSDFQNLKDLYQWSTVDVQREFSAIISSGVQVQGFQGVETKVLNISIESLTDANAEVRVTTQRIQTGSGQPLVPRDPLEVAIDDDTATSEAVNSGPRVSYETLMLSMIRNGDFWYVSDVTWE